jgi:hypothetical protein
MLTFKDTGPRDKDACPGSWFDSKITKGLRAFGCQFGFFRYGVLAKYDGILSAAAEAGMPVNFVLGSNPTDQLTEEDVSSVLGIVSKGENSSLTVVAFSNALFHPKVAYVVDSKQLQYGFVGSANFTSHAFGANVESWLEIEPSDMTSKVMSDIIESTLAWQRAGTNDGAYQVRNGDDIEQLLAHRVITTNKARRGAIAKSRESTGSGTSGLASRKIRWKPPKVYEDQDDELFAGSISDDLSGVKDEAELPEDVAGEEDGTYVDDAPVVVYRWCKQMSRSDVNRNSGNERNLMSLGKGPQGLNQVMSDMDNIRNRMLADQNWVPTLVSGREAEVATITALFSIDAAEPTVQRLEVVHAPHRGSDQANYHTCIRWNEVIARLLREAPGNGYVGRWAILEKTDKGRITLQISRDAPNPRGIGLR